MENISPKDLPSSFYTPKSFFSLNGAAVAVWIFCLVVGAVFPPKSITPIQYRIVALVLSEIIALIIVLRSRNRKMEYWFLAIFNGILIFVNASGWNVITSNTFFSDKTDNITVPPSAATQAGLFNIQQTGWWDDNSLFLSHRVLIRKYDSLMSVSTTYQEMVKKYLQLTENAIPTYTHPDMIIDSLKREILKMDNALSESNKTYRFQPEKNPLSNSQVYAFLDKMNILYVGIDNPITIFPIYNPKAVSIKFRSGIVNKDSVSGRYLLKPLITGPDTLIINNDGKILNYPVRIKALPDPAVFVGNVRAGAISSALFKASGGIIVQLSNSEFYAPFQVLSYKLGASGGSIQRYVESVNDGPSWSGSAQTIVANAGPGTQIFIEDLRVKGPDGKQRSIPTVVFELK